MMHVLTFTSHHTQSLKLRANWPSVHGYMPIDSSFCQGLVVLGIVLFAGGYLLSKLVALVTLVSSTSLLVSVGWCSVEAVALLVARYTAEGQRWRFHLTGLDGATAVVIHALFYAGVLAAPFPILRCTDEHLLHIYISKLILTN